MCRSSHHPGQACHSLSALGHAWLRLWLLLAKGVRLAISRPQSSGPWCVWLHASRAKRQDACVVWVWVCACVCRCCDNTLTCASAARTNGRAPRRVLRRRRPRRERDLPSYCWPTNQRSVWAPILIGRDEQLLGQVRNKHEERRPWPWHTPWVKLTARRWNRCGGVAGVRRRGAPGIEIRVAASPHSVD